MDGLGGRSRPLAGPATISDVWNITRSVAGACSRHFCSRWAEACSQLNEVLIAADVHGLCSWRVLMSNSEGSSRREIRVCEALHELTDIEKQVYTLFQFGARQVRVGVNMGTRKSCYLTTAAAISCWRLVLAMTPQIGGIPSLLTFSFYTVNTFTWLCLLSLACTFLHQGSYHVLAFAGRLHQHSPITNMSWSS